VAVQSNRSNTDAATRQQSIVEILWHRKQLVAIVFLLCVVSAAVLLKLTRPRVPVQSRLEVSRTVAANTDPNTVDLPTFLNTQAELIRSATVLSSAMGAPGMDGLSILADSENPINTLKDKLDVRPIPQSSVLIVRLTSSNVDEATQIVDAVDKAYLGYVEDQKKNAPPPPTPIHGLASSAPTRMPSAPTRKNCSSRCRRKMAICSPATRPLR